MEKVVAYKLTDGTLVLDAEEAVKKQSEIDFTKWLREFCDEWAPYSDGKSLIFAAINDNRNQILEMLKTVANGL